MIQTVGIKFEAQGLASVTSQMRTLASSVSSLIRGLGQLENLNTSATVAGLEKMATGMQSAAAKIALASKELTTASKQISSASTTLGHNAQTSVKPSASGGTGMSVLPLGFRSWAPFAAAYAAYDASKVVMGKGREDMIEPNLRLAGTGIVDKKWHRDIEKSSYDFTKKHPSVGSISELQMGASRLSSIHPFGEKDAPALTSDVLSRLTQKIALYGKLTEQSAEKASETLGFFVNSKLSSMSPAERKKYETQPGLLESIYERSMGLMQKAIDISGLTSQQIYEFRKHSQTMTSMAGWSDAQSLSLVSLMHDTGNRASSSGRAVKNLQSHTDKLGALSLLGNDNPLVSQDALKMKADELKHAGYMEYKRLDAQFKGDPFGLLEYIGRVRRQAEERNIDTSKYFSTDFRGQVMQATDPNAIAELRRREKIIETGVSMSEIEGRIKQVETQENTRLQRLSKRWDIIQKKAGDTPQDSISPIGGIDAAVNLSMDALELFATALVSPTTALNELGGHLRGFSNELIQIPNAIKNWWNKKEKSPADAPYTSQIGEPKPTTITTGRPISLDQEQSGIRPMQTQERAMTHQISGNVSGAATVRVEVDLKNAQQPIVKDVNVPISGNVGNSTARQGAENLQMMHQ